MQLSLSPDVAALYPGLLLGVVACRGIRNPPATPELTAMLRATEGKACVLFPAPHLVKTPPAIAAWQEAHRRFGSNPNKFPPSIQALLKRVAKGGELPAVNALVDLYNVVSLEHLLPVGGEDLDACTGDIRLARAEGTEQFVPLGETENQPPERGEVIYRDDAGALCRRFNWREAARTCLTERTRNAVLVLEILPPAGRAEAEAALDRLADLAKTHCGGDIRTQLLDAAHPSCEV